MITLAACKHSNPNLLALIHKSSRLNPGSDVFGKIQFYLGPGKGPGSSLEHSSTRNIIQKLHTTHHKSSRRLSARALKHICMACYGPRLSTLSLPTLSLSTTEKQQNITFLIGYNSRTVKDYVYCRPPFDRY